MLDHLKAQASLGRREIARLSVLVAGCLVVASLFVFTRKCQVPGEPEPPTPAEVPTEAEPGEPLAPPVVVDRARFLAIGDEASAHQDSSYERGALDYALSLVRSPLRETPVVVAAKDLAALAFGDAAGRVYEVAGTVTDVVRQEFRTPTSRLWSLVIEGKDGGRFVALSYGLASDLREGQPRSALRATAEWIDRGDYVVVRGIYLQRRSGTVGTTAIGEPVPALVAHRFRRTSEPGPAISDPSEAPWGEVEDRFLAETLTWEEPALFQTLRWAQEAGPEAVRAWLASGAPPAEDWTRPTFDVWEKEIQVESPRQPRPFTERARGRPWRFSGLIGQVVHEGWETVPGNPYGVDHLYLLDVLADDYAVLGRSIALRTFLPFPLTSFPGVTGEQGQHVRVTGLFVKNFVYRSQFHAAKTGGYANVTVPAFVVLDVEPIVTEHDRTAVWILAGSMVVLGALFYLVLIRGERREQKAMEEHRQRLRERMREKGQGAIVGGPRRPADGAAPPKGGG